MLVVVLTVNTCVTVVLTVLRGLQVLDGYSVDTEQWRPLLVKQVDRVVSGLRTTDSLELVYTAEGHAQRLVQDARMLHRYTTHAHTYMHTHTCTHTRTHKLHTFSHDFQLQLFSTSLQHSPSLLLPLSLSQLSGGGL